MRKFTALLDLPDHYALNIGLIIVCLPIVFGYLAVQKGQDNSWDTRNYHYYNAYAIVEGRLDLDIAPAQVQSFLNPTLDLFNYALIAHLSPRMATFALGLSQGINASLLFILCLVFFRAKPPPIRFAIALLSTAVGSYAPEMIGLIGTSSNDIITTIFVIIPLILIIPLLSEDRGQNPNRERWRLSLAGIFLGIGIGLKLTLAIYGIAFIMAVGFSSNNWKENIRWILIVGFAMFVGLLISRGWWMWYLFQTYESPLFPFYNSVFRSPYYPDINYADMRYLPKNLLDHLLFPFYRIYENQITYFQHGDRDIRNTIVYILILAWLVKRVWPHLMQEKVGERRVLESLHQRERFLLLFFIFAYLIWQLKFSIYRYDVPLELLAPVVIVVLIDHLFRENLHKYITFGLLALIIAVVMNASEWERLPFKKDYYRVRAPVIPDPSNTILLMAGSRPWAYLLPFFPPEIRVVRLTSNFVKVNQSTEKLLEEIKSAVGSHQGSMYLISRERYLKEHLQDMAAYDLKLADRYAFPIYSEHEPPGLLLIRVEKM